MCVPPTPDRCATPRRRVVVRVRKDAASARRLFLSGACAGCSSTFPGDGDADSGIDRILRALFAAEHRIGLFVADEDLLLGIELQPPAQDHRRSESTRLNSSHVKISYAAFCLNKKTMGT